MLKTQTGLAALRKEATPSALNIRAGLHRAEQLGAARFHELAKAAGLDMTQRQFDVLVAVADNEGLSQTGIVAATGIDRSTLADLVRRLQRHRLVQRRRTKEDTRAYAVRLAADGRRALAAGHRVAADADRFLLETLTAKEAALFAVSLEAVARR